ncbi:RlpA-like double-psi beta-barrel domain-containing protein [Lentzea sp.]|uniref:RlpA-like double-psi beta-barrel domain-containing protein n=1 Tax=Lentzea sp. TaxID=56099 RepID=UPI002BA25D55|nr:RlpA-like double-psi beta-barrel domain-containing protein [Lentzea sp.]HUQ55227.1 RlpA-like double-psi beta-barrel domain-containing protein [Lentzea sp.]
MNVADYENSAACGAHVLVKANGKSITVRITNLCPAPCRPGQLDLSAQAFAQLAPPVQGEIPVTACCPAPRKCLYVQGFSDRRKPNLPLQDRHFLHAQVRSASHCMIDRG